MTRYWLCENIPFTNTYEDVVSFDNQDAQRLYFQGLSVETNIINRVRFDNNRTTFRIKRPYNASQSVNYMMLEQDGEYFYLFIDSITYSDVDTTQIVSTIDVWQTYQFKHSILDAFISREHQDRFKISEKDSGIVKPIYNLEKENIELGEEYVTTLNEKFIDENMNNLTSLENISWYYIVTSESLSDKIKIPYTENGMSMGYYLYCMPYKENTIFYYNDTTKPFKWLVNMPDLFSDPKVVAIYVSRYAPTKFSLKGYGGQLNPTNYGHFILYDMFDTGTAEFDPAVLISDYSIYDNTIDKGLLQVRRLDNKQRKFTFYLGGLEDLKNNFKINNPVSDKYEPKLKTKPYTLVSFTDKVGEDLTLGFNEVDKGIQYIESFGPTYKSGIFNTYEDDSKYFKNVLNVKNNDVTLSNDRYKDYIANNKASATTGLAISGVTAVGGFALAGLSGGMAGVVGLSQGVTGTKAVINELLNQSDLKQAPNTIRNVGNNLQFSLSIDNNSIYLNMIIRQIREQFYNRALNYFHRLGYKANRFGVPNLKSRYYFNYIKTIKVSIGGNINQNTKSQLENIYNTGTTIWHYRGEDFRMYNYDYDNVEVKLIE